MTSRPIKKTLSLWWLRYFRFIRGRTTLLTRLDEGDVNYWRELSFLKIVAYVIPVSLLALLPRIIVGWLYGSLNWPLFDLSLYIIFCFVILQRRISVNFKKIFIIVIIYVFSFTLLIFQGANGSGILYFTCTCIFTGFMFQGNKIYLSLLANFVVVLVIWFIIYLRWFETPLIHQFSPLNWFNYISNLLFVNLVCLLLIQRIIRRLEKIIVIESELHGQLADEALEIEVLNNKLRESEDYYRSLFASNPSAMWVYDTRTLQFLQVNEAAIKLYGYNREEFLSMDINQIRPSKKGAFKGNMIHQKKNRKTFHVEVRSNAIEVNGIHARLVLATDITDRIRYVTNIEEQNARLKQIAWVQSHKVRAPLARIMSLSSLLDRLRDEDEREEITKYLMISADELNEVITTIIKKAEEQ